MKQRSTLAIVSLILESARNGATKTKITRDVMLNYFGINRYCTMLVENGLLSFNPANHRFETTMKGEEVLRSSGELFQSMPTVNVIIEKYRLPLAP
jgi:predicted transcriptional regulator